MRRGTLLDAGRERSFLTTAAGFAVGYGLFSVVASFVGTLSQEVDEEPDRWTYFLQTCAVFLIVLGLALLVLSRVRAR